MKDHFAIGIHALVESHGAAMRVARKPAALDRREVLADAVDLLDVGPAPEQRLRH